MACVGNNGELTESARKMLAALERALAPEQVAAQTQLPLFRVRGGLRELAEAGLVKVSDGVYSSTHQGRLLLLQSAPKPAGG